jgi:hypothetical protein
MTFSRVPIEISIDFGMQLPELFNLKHGRLELDLLRETPFIEEEGGS